MYTKHPSIRLKFEKENQLTLSFLDLKIIRNIQKKSFETSLYRRKSTFSGVFINFKNFIPMTYKFGLCELFRCFSICFS